MLDFTQHGSGDLGSGATPVATPDGDQLLLDAYSNAVIGVTERVGPAVVHVDTGDRTPGAPHARRYLGAGIVISPDGLVLTNNHVVGSSRQIRLQDIEGVIPPMPAYLASIPTPIWRFCAPMVHGTCVMLRSAIPGICAAASWSSPSAIRWACGEGSRQASCRRFAAGSAP